jgi:hypothetical protein
MGVIIPNLTKEFNKFHNTLELLGQAPGSSLTVYSDQCRVHLYCQAKCVRNSRRKRHNSQLGSKNVRKGLNEQQQVQDTGIVDKQYFYIEYNFLLRV